MIACPSCGRDNVGVESLAVVVEERLKAYPEAFEVAAEARAFLTSIGVDLEGKQQTKTKTALEFFAGAVRSENGHGS